MDDMLGKWKQKIKEDRTSSRIRWNLQAMSMEAEIKLVDGDQAWTRTDRRS